MDSVFLDGAGDVHQVLVDHGNEGGRMLCGVDLAEDFVEGVDVIGAVVGRQGNARKQNLDVGVLERGEDGVEVFASVVDAETAQPVVATEFDDDDGRMGAENLGKMGDGILGGGATGAHIYDVVMVAATVEVLLQVVRVRLALLDAVAGGNAVAVADEDRGVCGEQRKGG